MVEAALTFDPVAFDRAGRKLVTRELDIARTVVGTNTRDLEKSFESVTRAVVPGKLWRAWQSAVYPKSGRAYAPTGEVFVAGKSTSRAVGAITFWTQSGEIRGKNGQFLAVPLPAAGTRGRKRDLSPGEWERAHGVRLRFVYRPGRPSLLVLDGASLSKAGIASAGRGRVLNSAGRAVAGKGRSTVPIFVLLPVVKFRGAIALDPLVRVAGRRMVHDYLRAQR